MSLIRYVNSEELTQLNEPQYGQLFLDEDLGLLPHLYLIPNDPNFTKSSVAQLHIYSFYGDYISGDHNATYLIHDPSTNSLLVDVADTFRQANIRRGSYITVLNLFRAVWGSIDVPSVYVKEISPDRTELKLGVSPHLVDSVEFQNFKVYVGELQMENIFNNMVIDFGFNKISKLTLIRFDKNDPSIFYIKLYQPLSEDVENKDTAWFSFETMNPYVDTIILSTPIKQGQTTTLRGANYDIDTKEWGSNSTIYKSWNDLLDTDSPTTQRIIDGTISGSAQARLNIDYSDFNNYIFYSSAEERVKNFNYKVGLIEGYDNTISILQSTTASSTVFISGSISTNETRRDRLVSTMDSFERWMYYEATSSIFTHGVSGSITPYPKYIEGGRYNLHPTTSSIVTSWYGGMIASASNYDVHNTDRLWYSIPEHVVMDSGNSDYVLFVDMIGQHFDNLYSYTRALTKIHERDEHPERGASNDLLFHIAKSFGWDVQNTHQLSDLWFYKEGVNQAGTLDNSGSLFSVSRENQTQQIWRRIVNNLPYLLKTKGTSRSVKALIAIYGIPNTIISIKEYGGTSSENDKPQLIEDRFAYKLNFDGNQHIRLIETIIPKGGIGLNYASDPIIPYTKEFRFSTTYSSSVSMSLFQAATGVSGFNNPHFDISTVHYNSVSTSSYSGSYAYGYLHVRIKDINGIIISGSTDYLPIYDGDMWTVKLAHDAIFRANNGEIGTLSLDVMKAADCVNGQIAHSASLALVDFDGGEDYFGGGDLSTIFLGGNTGSSGAGRSYAHHFSGSIQNYREYMEDITDDTFRDHVLNPSAYHGNTYTSSFYELYRYFPLGGDSIRYDHTIVTSVTSSQPDRNMTFYNSASFIGWTGDQSTQYTGFRETYYIYTPSIGGNNIRNNKIRVEGSSLTRDLSPTGRSEKSQFDLAPIDTNRLAIVYSLTDHINRDIFNHMGFEELDDWIADPDLEMESEYSELKRISNEYYKKYEQKNAINSFIRILSVYDYTFFEQIKQLVPARADLIAGILIEPNILERSKVRLSRKPTVSNPQYDQVIPMVEKPLSGLYPTYEGSASAAVTTTMDHHYLTASIVDPVMFHVEHSYVTGSIENPLVFTGSSIHHTGIHDQRTGICGLVDVIRNRYSGSGTATQSIVIHSSIPSDTGYTRVVYHYSASGVFETKYKKQWYAAVSKSYGMYYSRSLEPIGYQAIEESAHSNSRFRGTKITGAGINIDSPDTVDGGPVVTVIESNPNNLFIKGNGDSGNLLVE